MLFLLRRHDYRQATLQSDGEAPVVALKTATLLAAPFVDLFCDKARVANMPPMVLPSLTFEK